MKALVETAVFGLLPVPPMHDTEELTRGRTQRPVAQRDGRALQEAELPPSFPERMATKGELAGLREELLSIGSD